MALTPFLWNWEDAHYDRLFLSPHSHILSKIGIKDFSRSVKLKSDRPKCYRSLTAALMPRFLYSNSNAPVYNW